MNIRHLEYLLALREHQHFGKAAEACFVSQPALSMQIQKLEAYLGVTLIERDRQHMMLTPVGQEIAGRAQQILQLTREMRQYAKSMTDPFAGECRLGIFPTLAPYLLPKIVPALHKALPKLALYLLEEKTEQILTDLNAGKLDVALLALPVEDVHLQAQTLFIEPFYFAVASNHPLAKRKKISVHETHDANLLLLDEGHCLRAQALSVCHLDADRTQQSFRATSLETLRHMVAANVGATFMPALACDKNRAITYLPFQQPTPARTIGLVWRKTSTRQPLIQALVKQMKQALAKNLDIKVC